VESVFLGMARGPQDAKIAPERPQDELALMSAAGAARGPLRSPRCQARPPELTLFPAGVQPSACGFPPGGAQA